MRTALARLPEGEAWVTKWEQRYRHVRNRIQTLERRAAHTDAVFENTRAISMIHVMERTDEITSVVQARVERLAAMAQVAEDARAEELAARTSGFTMEGEW